MTSAPRRKVRRRRSRDYPLPLRGVRYAELTDVPRRRDIRHATHGGELHAVGHGLYIPAPGTLSEKHRATLEALCWDSKHLVSHHTAAALWGLLETDPGPPYHLSTPPQGSRIKRPHLVIAHRIHIPEPDRAALDGLAITAPARTWVDIALNSSVLQGLIVADRCRRRGRTKFGEDPRAMASVTELDAALIRRGRPRGIIRARQALHLSRDGVDSPQETRLRYFMAMAGLPEPAVNAWIRDVHGRGVVQPDLSIQQYRLAIQYEGWEFHIEADQMAKDIRRQEITEALGWVEVRITREHMRGGGHRAIDKLVRALRRQGWRG
ncbi:hypothetical protein [Nesterenkonia natronophila]|uniref:DUF559 domain-containing protein n=1 Tax=Nesterenkonia natronophila TaxID=2174932 RepID=A0A3A4F204_9MICC|nr:hypothetical protein [Nesterenkonia natronophila]RJN31858.1 hypothetical protein D3250_07000 [Nesterenkonia natronophila]